MSEQSEAARMNGTCPSACSVWGVFRPDGSLSDIDEHKDVALARAVGREGSRLGWVNMAVKGWKCVEGAFTPNDQVEFQEGSEE